MGMFNARVIRRPPAYSVEKLGGNEVDFRWIL
jgi:hypothetical protein